MPAILRSRFPQIIAGLDPRVDAAVRTGAELVKQRAQERVADAPPIGQGLVSAIHVEDSDQSSGYYVVAGDKEHFYGHMLEFGTVKMAPQPFLIPAAEASRAEVAGIVSTALKGM